MAQKAQIVDLTKGYIPGDANTFPQNLVNTPNEDGEEKVLPILPYEGYNFMPTSYGYRSYFGETSKLDIGALPSRPQFILLYQLPTYQSRLIALCEDGIWVCNANVASSAWVQVVTQAFNPLIFEEWTHCLIENTLYFYKQGNAVVYYTNINATPDLEILNFTPSFLNMSGQMGIFKAGTRLGFWDSANSVSWSSNLDLHDFTPSLETLAGNTIFGSIVGRILLCKSHGEGFIVYSTRSVVGVDFSVTSNLLWDAKKVLDNTGIAHSRAVVSGTNDSEHYMYGTTGIYRIGGFSPSEGRYNSEAVLPELYDYLGKSRTPITLTLLQDRFLCFSAGSSDAIYGQTAFRTVAVDSYSTVVNWYLPTSEPPAPTVVVDKPLIVEIITSITTVNPTTIASKEANYSVRPSIITGLRSYLNLEVLTAQGTGFEAAIASFPKIENMHPTFYGDNPLLLNRDNVKVFNFADILPVITDVRPGFFSLHASSDRQRLGKLIAAQEAAWSAYEVLADRVISAVANRERQYVGTTPFTGDISTQQIGGEYRIDLGLTGKGRIEVLSSNDFLHHTMDDVGNKLIIRKYFSEMAVLVGTSASYPYYNNQSTDVPLETPMTLAAYKSAYDLYDRAYPVIEDDAAAIRLWVEGNNPQAVLNHEGAVDRIRLYNLTYLGSCKSTAEVYSRLRVPLGELVYPGGTVGFLTDIAEYSSEGRGQKISTYRYISFLAGEVHITPLILPMGAIEKEIRSKDYRRGKYITSIEGNVIKGLVTATILITTRARGGGIEQYYKHDAYVGTYEERITITNGGTSASHQYDSDLPSEESDNIEATEHIEYEQGNFGYTDFEANLIKYDFFNPYTLDIISSTTATTIVNPPILINTGDGSLNNRDTWSYSTYQAPSSSYYELTNGKFGIYSIGDGIGEVQVYSTPPAANTFQIGLNSTVTVPGTNFILQTGGIDTAYPIYAGSFVFDMQLKKWGKYKGDHMLLVETTPINSAISSTITYTDLGMDAASFKGDSFLHPFSNEPEDSYIKYGKLGVYRLGMTSLQEVRIHQAQASNYKVQVESSKEGLAITDLSDEVTYSSNMSSTTYCSVSARWHSIKISGTFDLTGLEIRTKIAGRR